METLRHLPNNWQFMSGTDLLIRRVKLGEEI